MRFLSLVVPLFLVAAPAAAQDKVEGTVTYDGQSVAMTHVYARETRGSPTRDDPPQVVVLIADRAAPPKVVASRQAYYAAAREGAIRGLIVTFDEPSSPKARLAVFVPGASDDTSIPDVLESIALTELKREGGVVSGRLRTSEPRRFLPDEAGADTPQTYALDLRFRAAVTPAARPTQVLTGTAAQASQPVAVAHRMLELVHKGATGEMKALLLPGHPLAKAIDSGEASDVLPIARALLPKPATFRPSVQRVIFYGDEAAVVAKDAEGTTDVWLRRVDGQWKLADPPIPND